MLFFVPFFDETIHDVRHAREQNSGSSRRPVYDLDLRGSKESIHLVFDKSKREIGSFLNDESQTHMEVEVFLGVTVAGTFF